MNHRKTQFRALALGTTGALVAGLIAAAAPAQAAVNVDQPPTKTVSGELSGPIGIEDDAAGNIYIASQNNNSVVVHAKNATGPSVSLRRLSGANTGLTAPRDVAIDSNGFLYVSLLNGTVRVFAPGANGNVAPVKSFGTGPGSAWAIDIAGGEIYVRKNAGYNVYALSASGFPAPTERAVTGLGAGRALKVTDGKIWTPSGTQLRSYAPSADLAATPLQTVTNALPVSEANGLDADSAGRIYVTSFVGTVRVFAPSASGADQPLKVLGGPASGVQGATGVTILSGDAFAVAGFNQDNYRVFSTLFPKAAKPTPKKVTKPGKVRSLKVTGKIKAKKRAVRWTAPKSNGGSGITSYRIVIKKGKKTLLVKNVAKNKRAFVVNRSKLRKGVNTVYIQAKNKKGYGPQVKKNFRVKK